MPPPGGNKRKRGDRMYSEDDFNRPSPHRPGSLDLARPTQPRSPTYTRNGYDGRGRGNRKSIRGGRNTFETSHTNHQQSAPVEPPLPNPTATNTRSTPDAVVPPTIQIEAPQVFQPYSYTFLTDDLCFRWDQGGKEEIGNELARLAKVEEGITRSGIIQELIQAALSTVISAKDAGKLLKEHIEPSVHASLQDDVIDALSIAFEDNQTLQRTPLADFISGTGISADVLRQEFDQDLLQKMGMIRSTFGRMGIRKQTNVLYRQANFNLMREESEGFAKLMTELFTTSSNEPPTGVVVDNAVENVKAMIGAFDLDVGRSLDVVLDVFGSVLVKQFRFFVKFLRASPWWPRTYDTTTDTTWSGGLPRWAHPGVAAWKLSEDQEEEARVAAQIRDTAFWPLARELGLRAFQQIGRVVAPPATTPDDDDFDSIWVRETGTLPIAANRDAAQLLGFKLRFYSSSASRDHSDVLPDNLIFLSALLIKIGFISLNDLYPHIWRSDEEMEELKAQKVKERAERERMARPGAGVKNALLLAGALADDTVNPTAGRLREAPTRSGTPAKENEPPKETSSESPDQKVSLLKSLLAIGALPEAFFILGRFPWILDLYPEVPEYIHRILHHSLSKIYLSLRPLEGRNSLNVHKPLFETGIPGIPKGQVRLTEAPSRRILRWAHLDRTDSNDGTDYRFYWDEWNDNIPVCQTLEDVITICHTILPLVGVKIGQDPALVLKFTRIGKFSVQSDPSQVNRDRWLDLIKRILLPCLSLTKPNAGLVNEVYDFIGLFPTAVRYVMYLEWSSGRVSRNTDVKAAFDQAKAETKDILKRISKTNVKPMARSLAKIAYANPHVVITTALAQIEVYDSIAEVFVEGSRYFTDLGYDVLNFALISSMARAGRSRTQDGGIFTSRWLSALSQFAGKIYKRYGMMKPGPVLQYVTEQLEAGNSTDLKMLEQIVVAMAGIATDTSFNDAQLQAMGGGPLLQSQTILQLLDRRNDSKPSTKRLLKALQDHDLTAKLLLSMAQQRQACVFEDGDVPLKAIGNTFDEIDRIMHQYLDLLRSSLSADDFQNLIPDVAQLLLDYDLTADVAFWISRPVLAKQMNELERGVSTSNTAKEASDDIDMKDDESSEEDGEAIDTEDVTGVTPSDLAMSEALEDDIGTTGKSPEEWNPVLRSVMDHIRNSLPSELVDSIGVGFYVTFWQLSLYDISVPSKSYEDEMSRQRKKITAITADRSNISAAGAKTRENTVKQHQQLIDNLLAENKNHLKAYSESRTRLQKEKEYWFADKQRKSAEINTALMEYCFLPRMMFSPQDAYFCFKFIKFLHSNGTPNFRTLGFYDALLKPDRLASLFFMCTSKESDNLARFLSELLRDLARWHKDKNVYEREAFGSKRNLPGFAMKVENGKPSLLLDFEQFRRILFKWHSNLYSALIKCLSSTEYMHVRNAISVLRSVSSIYPAVNFHGTALQKAVGLLGKSDREDLKVSSSALQGALHRREKEWVLPQAFRQGPGLDKVDEQKESKPDITTTAKDEAGESKALESTIKAEAQDKRLVVERIARPSPRPASVGPPKSRPQAPATNDTYIPSRPPVELSPSHRTIHSSEPGQTADLPRRLSPPRHQPPASLPVRPESDTRNGRAESPRSSVRIIPENRTSHPRYAHERDAEPPFDPAYRHGRPHDRPMPPERDERVPRREQDVRHGYDREIRGDRDVRIDHSRPTDREIRTANRDTARPPYDVPDRRRPERSERPERPERPDLLDERRSTPSVPTRNTALPAVAASVNPDRAALINSTEQRAGLSIRGQAQDKNKLARPPSPRRDDDRRNARQERDDRNRHESFEHYDRSSRLDRLERTERPERAENVDRAERFDRRQEVPGRIPGPLATNNPPSRPTVSNNHSRDSRSYHQPPVDLQHGRLEPESPSRPPPRERTEQNIPLGPKARPSNGPRKIEQPSTTAAPTMDRPPPTGPSKHSRSNTALEITQAPPSMPTSDTSGVHPDRMSLVATQELTRPLAKPVPPAPQISPPSGPRSNGALPPPPGPSSNARSPPGGPQNENAGRGRRHQLATVNSTLAQASGPRGRGRGESRQSNSFPPPTQSPIQGSRPDFAQSDPSNPNGVPVQPRQQINRRDSSKDLRNEQRHRHDNKDVNFDGQRKSDRREDGHRDSRGYRTGDGELPPRKHMREDSGGFPAGVARGGRNANDGKRPRRGQ